MELTGKVFVVTGGGNGIGREVVLGLLTRGARAVSYTHLDVYKRQVRVFPHERFTSDEAAAIFADFARTDTVDARYTRRELDLSVAQSERH